jgi:hypothetical protein
MRVCSSRAGEERDNRGARREIEVTGLRAGWQGMTSSLSSSPEYMIKATDTTWTYLNLSFALRRRNEGWGGRWRADIIDWGGLHRHCRRTQRMELGSQLLRRPYFALFLRGCEASFKVLDVSLIVCYQFVSGAVRGDAEVRHECILLAHFPHRQSHAV